MLDGEQGGGTWSSATKRASQRVAYIRDRRRGVTWSSATKRASLTEDTHAEANTSGGMTPSAFRPHLGMRRSGRGRECEGEGV